MTRNATEAEDLTQEVFIQVLTKIGSFRGESRFTTWLHRLTVNRVLMHFRRVTQRHEQMPGEIEWELKIRHIGKLSRATDLVEKIALDAALAKLPSGCRAVFFLFDIEGYKHEEIADIFGCSVGNSKSQLHKARKKLRHFLQS
jgi:RNA polymerase sigma-70 factor (ECF subfamily)